jgi:hypothetical protein
VKVDLAEAAEGSVSLLAVRRIRMPPQPGVVIRGARRGFARRASDDGVDSLAQNDPIKGKTPWTLPFVLWPEREML